MSTELGARGSGAPPAAAYHLVARLLPDDYFVANVPAETGDRSVKLVATGGDDRPTEWLIPHRLASSLHPLLRQEGRLRSFEWVSLPAPKRK